MKELKPENLRIKLVEVSKTVTKDNYEHAQDPKTTKNIEIRMDLPSYHPSVTHAFNSFVRHGPKLTEKDIRTFDPNYYRDQPGGGAVVVRDNTGAGRFRCMYDRQENNHGRPPTEAEMNAFRSGTIDLKAAVYEIHFEILVVGLQENELAEFLGVTSPDA